MNSDVELLYQQLEDHVRANNVEGMRRIYRNLLQSGRSVAEITDTMHNYILKSASKSELEISPNNELPKRAARPELAKSSSEVTSLDSDLAFRSDTPRGSSDSTPNLVDESEPRGLKDHAQFPHRSSGRRFAALRSPIALLAIIGVAATAGGLLILHPATEKPAVMATFVLNPSSLPSGEAPLTLMPTPASTPRDEGLQTSAAAPAAPAPDTTLTVAPPEPAPPTEAAPIVAAAPAPDTTLTVAPPEPAPPTEAAPIVAAAPAPDTTPTVAPPEPAAPTEAAPIVAAAPAPDTTPTVAPPEPAAPTEAAPIVAAAPAPDKTPTVAPPEPAPPTEAAPIVAAAPAALVPETAPTVAMIGPATPSAEPRVSTLKGSVGEISSLLTRGDSLLGVRDVTSARLYYERAADAGDAQAALRLGKTYDPAFLALARLNEVRGDPVVAARWYRHARDLGNPEAEILLKSLHAN
jgi:hypothetical protein